jgi:hypothetical protein
MNEWVSEEQAQKKLFSLMRIKEAVREYKSKQKMVGILRGVKMSTAYLKAIFFCAASRYPCSLA